MFYAKSLSALPLIRVPAYLREALPIKNFRTLIASPAAWARFAGQPISDGLSGSQLAESNPSKLCHLLGRVSIVSGLNRRQAFTLIELVVVIIIIAILAAIAVPKFIDRASEAREAATLQSLATLRSSIELYRADNSAYPTALQTDLAAYLKGQFPISSVGTESSTVVVVTNSPITNTDVTAAGGWLYNSTTGEIRINNSAYVTR